MAMAAVEGVARPLSRLAGLRTHHPLRYVLAVVVMGTVVGVIEVYCTDLEHGTHLLVLLGLVAFLALRLGPGSAWIGLFLGGGVSGATSFGVVEPPGHPNTLVQLGAYLLTGSALIVLAAVALRTTAQRAAALERVRLTDQSHPPIPVEALTPREQEVLRLAAGGAPVAEIGQALFVSPNTVKTHLTRSYAKLGARGRPEAIRLALHFGYLSPTDICPHARQGAPMAASPRADGHHSCADASRTS
jgi:DNA-binding CsgD family transcriptional regulator